MYAWGVHGLIYVHSLGCLWSHMCAWYGGCTVFIRRCVLVYLSTHWPIHVADLTLYIHFSFSIRRSWHKLNVFFSRSRLFDALIFFFISHREPLEIKYYKFSPPDPISIVDTVKSINGIYLVLLTSYWSTCRVLAWRVHAVFLGDLPQGGNAKKHKTGMWRAQSVVAGTVAGIILRSNTANRPSVEP